MVSRLRLSLHLLLLLLASLVAHLCDKVVRSLGILGRKKGLSFSCGFLSRSQSLDRCWLEARQF